MYITNPNNVDTDGDDYSDGLKAQWKTDPTDPSSYNPEEIPKTLDELKSKSEEIKKQFAKTKKKDQDK